MERKLMKITANTRFTVLKRTDGQWLDDDNMDWMGKLPGPYKPAAAFHSKHPEFLVIRGEYDRATVESALGASDFEYSIIEGPDNPELPFHIPKD